MKRDGRDKKGRFARGNPGGPGRPPRPIEREYLATLSNQVSIDVWRRIVDKAVKDAEGGDARAREWLAKYLLGEMTLTELAKRERMGITADAELPAEIDAEFNPSPFDTEHILRPTILQRIMKQTVNDDESEKQTQSACFRRH